MKGTPGNLACMCARNDLAIKRRSWSQRGNIFRNNIIDTVRLLVLLLLVVVLSLLFFYRARVGGVVVV